MNLILNMVEYIFTNTGWVTPLLSIIGLVISLSTAIRSFNKQMYLQVNRERLELVYFPLVTAVNSYAKSTSKAYDLYWYLKDRMQDEKYITLIKSKKVINSYLNLNDYYLLDAPVINTKQSKALFNQLVFFINKEYKSIKMKSGYDFRTYTYSIRCFFIAYSSLLIGAVTSKGLTAIPDLSWLVLFTFFIFLLFLGLSLILALVAFKNEWPSYKRSLHETVISIKQHYKEKQSKR